MDTASRLQEVLTALLAGAVRQGVFPGAAAAVAWGPPPGRQDVVVTSGATGSGSRYPPVDRRTCFDLASLTKPFATALSVLCLIKEGSVALTDSLPFLLPERIPPAKRDITLRHLLSHSAGLAAYRPYFQALAHIPPEERQAAVKRWLLAEPLLSPPGEKALYSDLDFLLLGLIVAEKAGRALDRVVAEKVLGPLGLAEEIFFQPLCTGGRDRVFAATENCPWRGRVLCGEVHDDNAHALGGVAGHAGLFGTVGGVLALATHLLDIWQGRAAHPCFRPEDLQEFLAYRSRSGSSWALGFDTPSPAGSAAGRHFSPASIGHLGFTGTSFWIDPERELTVVLLTNRVHPSRENDRIKAFRPLFHDAVVETLKLC